MSQLPPKNLFPFTKALEPDRGPQGLGSMLAAMGLPEPKRHEVGIVAAAMGLGTPHNLRSDLAFAHPAAASAWSPTWPFVIKRFTTFLDNLKLTAVQRIDGEKKFKGVVKKLNQTYWNSDSETDHAFYVGSWAKQTNIRPPRDVDLYFLLPREVYFRFEQYKGNKQSALLQEVKGSLLESYPLSNIKGDGPVVHAAFWSFNIEVVPAFLLDASDRLYYVCNTKNGGSYKTTKPLHEVDAIEFADQSNNGNVRRLVCMLKCWQAHCSVPIKSFYLELLATDFLNQWQYRDQSYFYYDWMCRDFFQWMVKKANTCLRVPGTFELMNIGDSWKSRAVSAYNSALKACEYEQFSRERDAGDEWQKIFGSEIPKWI